MESVEIILATVSGLDQPGITSRLMQRLSEFDVEITDMGQSVTHGLLSLSFVLKSSSTNSAVIKNLVKDLLFECKALNLNFDFKEISKELKDLNQKELQSSRFILSCISSFNFKASFIRDISSLLARNKINILRIDNTHPKQFKSLEFTTICPSNLDFKKIKSELLSLSEQHRVDLAFIEDDIYRWSKRLIVFDMDSTLLSGEVIDEMAQAKGCGAEIKAITEAAMNGELDFSQSLKKRVSALKGLSTNELDKIYTSLKLNEGVEEFISVVKQLGYKVALISGGFSYFADRLKEKLGLDYAFANQLAIENNLLTGSVEGEIIDSSKKATLLKLITQQEGINLKQVVAIGDGANDLEMLSAAGLGIAYHAKHYVKENAGQYLSFGPMTTVLHFLGIQEKLNNQHQRT